jgi:hypothetical protein
MLQHPTEEEHSMKHGHVTGHKQERTGQGWYQTEEAEALIRQLEAAWQARQQQAQQR